MNVMNIIFLGTSVFQLFWAKRIMELFLHRADNILQKIPFVFTHKIKAKSFNHHVKAKSLEQKGS